MCSDRIPRLAHSSGAEERFSVGSTLTGLSMFLYRCVPCKDTYKCSDDFVFPNRFAPFNNNWSPGNLMKVTDTLHLNVFDAKVWEKPDSGGQGLRKVCKRFATIYVPVCIPCMFVPVCIPCMSRLESSMLQGS